MTCDLLLHCIAKMEKLCPPSSTKWPSPPPPPDCFPSGGYWRNSSKVMSTFPKSCSGHAPIFPCPLWLPLTVIQADCVYFRGLFVVFYVLPGGRVGEGLCFSSNNPLKYTRLLTRSLLHSLPYCSNQPWWVCLIVKLTSVIERSEENSLWVAAHILSGTHTRSHRHFMKNLLNNQDWRLRIME